MKIEDVIIELGKLIAIEKKCTSNPSRKDWWFQEGVLLSLDEAICIYEELTKANPASVGNGEYEK